MDLSTRINNTLAGVFSESMFRGDFEVLMRVKVGFDYETVFEGSIFFQLLLMHSRHDLGTSR